MSFLLFTADFVRLFAANLVMEMWRHSGKDAVFLFVLNATFEMYDVPPKVNENRTGEDRCYYHQW